MYTLFASMAVCTSLANVTGYDATRVDQFDRLDDCLAAAAVLQADHAYCAPTTTHPGPYAPATSKRPRPRP